MKIWKERAISALCLTALLLPLFGCAKEEGLGVGAMGSEVWETMPALTYGEMEYEKLQVLDWNSGRCEAVSWASVAETENGFYYAHSPYLYYADKNTPNDWVPVCSNADCMHNSIMTCDARLLMERFVIRDGRIFYEELSGKYPELYRGSPNSFILLSRSADGNDRRLAYVPEEAAQNSGGTSSVWLGSDLWLYYSEKLNTDGSTGISLYVVDKDGIKTLYEDMTDEVSGTGTVSRVSQLYGDCYYQCSGVSTDEVFRVEGDQIIMLDASLIPDNGGYISGSTLRVFRQDDGYYDINIENGEEVKIADAQLTNSNGQTYLPNCIVESTLLVGTMEMRTEGMTHEMVLFDGESWRSVQLPEELIHAGENTYIHVDTITSDSIIFQCREKNVSVSKTGKILY